MNINFKFLTLFILIISSSYSQADEGVFISLNSHDFLFVKEGSEIPISIEGDSFEFEIKEPAEIVFDKLRFSLLCDNGEKISYEYYITDYKGRIFLKYFKYCDNISLKIEELQIFIESAQEFNS